MARRQRQEEGGGDSWLNTYADMVTLLLTFFAVLLSLSTINEEKFNAFIESFSNLPKEQVEAIISGDQTGDGTNGGGGNVSEEQTIDDLYQYLKTYVEENNQQDAIEISSSDDVVYIRFNSDFYFEPNRYTLRAESYPSLSFIGDGIKMYQDQIRIMNICGHTADPQYYSENISWMLSGERAAVVAEYFEDQKGIDPTKMIVLGYSDNFPVAPNDTEENMRKNRRVELIIVGTKSSFDVSSLLGGEYNQEEFPTMGGTTDILIPSEEEKESQADQSQSNPEESESSSVESGVSPYQDE